MTDASSTVPSLEALFAATLALMTRWAETVAPAHEEAPCRLRSLLARKIVSNLFFLQHHPTAGEQFRQIVANVHQAWQGMAGTAQDSRPVEQPAAPADGKVLH
jgi:hypothetical protein